jgi:hypothetical protein
MTVIAWDGKTLASDRLGDAGGLKRSSTKIFRFEGGLFGSAGWGSHASHMFDWIKKGANPETVPAFQLTEDYQSVLVVRNDGTVWIYGKSAYPFQMEDKFHACGSGRDFAIAAMHLGQDAVTAVAVASVYDTGCGMGIDQLTLENG